MKRFVGLANSGSCCYANSLFQQFLAIPQICELVLSSDCTPLPSRTAFVTALLSLFEKTQTESVLTTNCFELLQILAEENKREFDCHKQRDISDFLSEFLSALKRHLPSTLEVVKGSLLNELRTKEMMEGCQRRKEEPFYFISLDMGSEAGYDLESSLHYFVRAAELPFFWKLQQSEGSPSQESLPTLKQTRFLSLPTILIFHLKRFTFDLKAMKTKKVNHQFSFPDEIDMLPYCDPPRDSISELNHEQNKESVFVEACPSSRYKLRGVIVHRGNAEDGHYYSLVRFREEELAKCNHGKRNSSSCAGREGSSHLVWVKFNDEEVSMLPEESFERVAFGASETSRKTGKLIWSPENAAVLLYEKIPVPS